VDNPLRVTEARDLAQDWIESIEVVARALLADVAGWCLLLVQEVGIHIRELNEVRVQRVPVNSVLDHRRDGELPIAATVHVGHGIVDAHLPSEPHELGLLRLVNHKESEILRIPRPREVAMRDRVLEALDESSPCGQEDIVVGRLAVLVDNDVEDTDVGKAGLEVDDVSEKSQPD